MEVAASELRMLYMSGYGERAAGAIRVSIPRCACWQSPLGAPRCDARSTSL